MPTIGGNIERHPQPRAGAPAKNGPNSWGDISWKHPAAPLGRSSSASWAIGVGGVTVSSRLHPEERCDHREGGVP